MIVLDVSATAFALLDGRRNRRPVPRGPRADSQWLAPEHWLVEVLSVIRGNLLGGKMKREHAAEAAVAAAEMDPVAVPTRPLAARIWGQVRGNLTAYDAAYVAAAERAPAARW